MILSCFWSIIKNIVKVWIRDSPISVLLNHFPQHWGSGPLSFAFTLETQATQATIALCSEYGCQDQRHSLMLHWKRHCPLWTKVQIHLHCLENEAQVHRPFNTWDWSSGSASVLYDFTATHHTPHLRPRQRFTVTALRMRPRFTNTALWPRHRFTATVLRTRQALVHNHRPFHKR